MPFTAERAVQLISAAQAYQTAFTDLAKAIEREAAEVHADRQSAGEALATLAALAYTFEPRGDHTAIIAVEHHHFSKNKRTLEREKNRNRRKRGADRASRYMPEPPIDEAPLPANPFEGAKAAPQAEPPPEPGRDDDIPGV